MSGQDETQKGWSSGLKVLLLVILVARAQAFHVSPGMGALSVLSTRKARTGICVAADPVRSDSTEGGLNADTDPYAARRRRIHVMVHQLARIGSDLDALGPDGDSVRVVEELEARIDALQHQVMDAKERSVRMQMYAIADAADLDNLASSGKVKLHLGCGRNTLPGWLNADLYGWRLNSGDGWDVNRAKERVLSINVGTTPLPLPDGSCEFVYTSHMLEHLIHPAQTRLVMEEVHRVLAPGGTVRVVVPDAGVWLRGYAEHDASFFATVRQEWPFWDWAMLDSAAGSRLDYILPYLGASSLQGHLAGDHQFGFDEASLRALMVSAGFGSDAVIRSKYQQSPHPALLVDNASEAAAAKFASPGRGEVFLSLFIEATKSFEPLRHAPTSASASLVASSPSYVTSSSPPSAHHQPAMTGSSSRSGGRVRRALQWVVKRIVGAN